jgi:hypothetical protein
MPNVIKYSTGATPTGCLRKGNMLIGNNTADYGLTFFNGINPPVGGYTIYLNKASGGPSIYCPANDTQLIGVTNQIAGANYTTVAQCLDYYASQTDKICVNFNYEGIVTNGLVLNLDAGFDPSYPTTGTTWYDISSGATNNSLTNGPGFNSSNSGSIVFDGTNDAALQYSPNLSTANGTKTVLCWCWPDSTGPSDTYTGLVSWGGRSNASPSDSLLLCLNTTAATWYVGSAYWYNDYNPSILPVNKNAWNMVGIIARQQSVPNSNNTTLICGNNNGLNYDTGTSDPNRSINTANMNLSIGSTDIISRPFKGRIANVLIYNRELTTAELTQNFNAQKARFGL